MSDDNHVRWEFLIPGKRATKRRASNGTVAVTLAQLVEQPHLASRIGVGEAPQLLAHVNALLTRVTELKSNLERMVQVRREFSVGR